MVRGRFRHRLGRAVRVDEAFGFDGGELHAAGEPVGGCFEAVVGCHAGDGDGQAEDGGEEGFPDPACEVARVYGSGEGLDLGECEDHTEDGAEEAEEGAQVADGGEDLEASFHAVELFRAGFADEVRADVCRFCGGLEGGADDFGNGMAAGSHGGPHGAQVLILPRPAEVFVELAFLKCEA